MVMLRTMGFGLLASSCFGAGIALADDAPAFDLVDAGSVRSLFLAEFAPGTTERGAIETQTPAVRLPVTSLHLAIDTSGDTGCVVGLTGEAALGSKNILAPGPAAGACLFLAELSIATAQGAVQIEGQCGDWRKDVSYCWVESDAGQFWLRRRSGDSKSLQLILGSFGDAVETASLLVSGRTPEAAAIPTRGVMAESVFDDAGRAVTDRWLLLPPGVVTLDIAR
jgi:hypothetical protein